jgi:hypothetical protein
MRFTSMVSLFIVLVGMGKPLWGKQDAGPTPQIIILVFDQNGLAVPVLIEAERQATAIFRRAGINVDWRNCSLVSGQSDSACHQIQGPTQFVMTIVNRSVQPANDIFGVAFLGEHGTGKYVDVFFDNITKLRHEGGSGQASLLGAVAAHEIGHLLLGSHSHSQWGLMSPHWEVEDLRRLGMGTLMFTPEQALLMRTRIAGFEG